MEADRPPITLEQLRSLAGCAVRFRGRVHVVIEILSDGPAVVLAPAEEAPGIQGDAYGTPRRRAPVLVTVPVFTGHGTELHPEFLELDLSPTAPASAVSAALDKS